MEGLTLVFIFIIASYIYNSETVRNKLATKILNFHLKRVSMSQDLRDLLIHGNLSNQNNMDYINALIKEIEDIRNVRIASHSVISSIFVSFGVAFTGIFSAYITSLIAIDLNTVSAITDKQLEIALNNSKKPNADIVLFENKSKEIINGIIENITNPTTHFNILFISFLLAIFPMFISKIIIKYGVTGILDKRLVVLREIVYENLKNHK
ncbi:hypothetical protein [Macrococcus capreoli]|uniref:hypothetical protein n=1 Tax=Macrococcus capreoli TaxID=2982690 RepID=UPI0021D5DA1E|nr:hypothetical protein [Macrococcus sp. TMW 2.2395]MCU7558619.1 hypothetical protein [Macrococcus sp. TMW 2.2395]